MGLRVRLLAVAFSALVAPATHGAGVVLGAADGQQLESAIEVLDDGGRFLDPMSARASPEWHPAAKLERGSARSWWVRFVLVAPPASDGAWVLRPDQRWRHVDLWVGSRSQQPVATSGTALTSAARTLQRGDLGLPFALAAGHEAEILVRLEGNFAGYSPPRAFLIDLRESKEDRARREQSRTYHGAYGGIVLALVIYNLFLAFSLRDRAYLLYVALSASFGLIWLARAGLGIEVLWPEAPAFDAVSTFVWILLAVLAGNTFTKAFLELDRVAVLVARILDWCCLALLPTAALAMLGRWQLAENLLALTSLVSATTYPIAGVIAWRSGIAPARYFVLANAALVGGVVAYILAYFGVLPDSPAITHAAQIGSALEMILLSLALADRISILRGQRDRAEALVRAGLEAEVRSRTHELERHRERIEKSRSEAEEANRRLTEANRRLEEASLRDQLTGVANRRRFDRALAAEWQIATLEGSALSLALLDLDHFKAFNDRYGHQAGDRCLQRFARLVAETTRHERDVVARWGGEEFAFLLPNTSTPQALALAERLCDLVASVDFSPDGDGTVSLTVSIGVATATPATTTSAPDELLRAADDALYAAKDQGRNRAVSASSSSRNNPGVPPEP